MIKSDIRRAFISLKSKSSSNSSCLHLNRLVGKRFKYKQEELEDDLDFKFKDKRPTNIALYNYNSLYCHI